MNRNIKPRVVIVGAGFGGLWAARRLADEPVDVLLVDRNNYHTFLASAISMGHYLIFIKYN